MRSCASEVEWWINFHKFLEVEKLAFFSLVNWETSFPKSLEIIYYICFLTATLWNHTYTWKPIVVLEYPCKMWISQYNKCNNKTIKCFSIWYQVKTLWHHSRSIINIIYIISVINSENSIYKINKWQNRH